MGNAISSIKAVDEEVNNIHPILIWCRKAQKDEATCLKYLSKAGTGFCLTCCTLRYLPSGIWQCTHL